MAPISLNECCENESIFFPYKMYCLKCKRQTETKDIQQLTTKNNRLMLKGKCVVCGTKKAQFISNKKGKGIVNKAINNLPFEMHLPGHNFTGPGTRLDKRLNSDFTPKETSKPYNKVDKASMNHDICYAKNTDTKTRNKLCDKEYLKELKGIYNPSIRERIDRTIVSNIINAKMKLGMGTSTK